MNLRSAASALFASPGSLRRRASSAGLWNIIELGSSNAIRLFSNVAMSYFIAPKAFGYMTMVNTLIFAMTMFTDIGIRQSVVRSSRGEEPYYLRVAWCVQIIRSCAIAVLVVGAGVVLVFGRHFAPPQSVYASPDLPLLVMVAALSVVIQGFQSNNEWLAARRLQYGRTTALNIASQLVGFGAMIGFALIEPSAWALLAGWLAAAVTKTVLSHIVLQGPRMGFVWDKDIADELWHFGKWILGSSSLAFVVMNIDRLVLGALIDEHSFGIYAIATLWIAALALVLQKMVDQVIFPVLSEIQRTRPGDLRVIYFRVGGVLDAVGIAGCLAAAVVGPLLIHWLYSSNYARAADYLPLLSLTILHVRYYALGRLVLAHGDSRTMMVHSAVSAALLCTGLAVGYWWLSIGGALLALVIAPVLASCILTWRAAELTGRSVIGDLFWALGMTATGVTLLMRLPN